MAEAEAVVETPEAAPEAASSVSEAPQAEEVSLAEGGGTDKETPAASNWPADWRERLAGGDEAVLKRLNRFTQPENLTKSWWNQLAALSKQAPAKPETEDAEALNKWRESVGLPKEPKGYLDSLPEGLVIGEEDAALAESFLQVAHASDMPPNMVAAALAWHNDLKEQQVTQQMEADRQFRVNAEEELRSEWGPEYRATLNNIHSVFDTIAPEGLLDRFFAARMPDGTLFGDDPDALRFLAAVAKEVNPYGTVVPSAGRDMDKSIEEELSQLRTEMGDRRGLKYDYWSNPGKQQRYQELLTLQERRQR